jgi:taurine dioxygenase
VRHWFAKRPAGRVCCGCDRISHHFAAVCPDIEPFAAEGFVALAMVNGSQRMVLWGGNRKLLGTSPMPFAGPRPSRLPLVRDQRRASWRWARSCLPAPRSLLAVSCPVSEYDRSPGMIGEDDLGRGGSDEFWAEENMAPSPQQSTGRNTYVEVVPLTLHIGAEIRGVDLSKPLPPEQLKEVRDAFLKWKVVFFRGQNLDHAQHVAMARQFGEPTIGHAVFGHVEGYPEVYSVAKNRTANENREQMMVTPWSGWHTDITAAVNPPCASILRGVTIPPYGGDTFWTNLVAAYQGLSPTMRGFVEGLRAVHANVARANPKPGQQYNERIERRPLASEHPLVTMHAETGERVLFASPSYIKSIVGLTPREGQKLLELIWEHVTRPEYTVRFKWNAGDIAFWDNRSTSHLAPTDIFQSDFDRQLYRITLVGQPLVGVDGRLSTAIEGLPILSAAEELRMMAAD